MTYQKIEPVEKDYVGNMISGKIYVSNFPKGSSSPKGKVISTVTDEVDIQEQIIYKTSRTQIKATYILEKKQIVELKIQKYEIKDGELQDPPVEIRINSDANSTLTDFLGFLLKADMSSVASGRLSFDKNIHLDPQLESKLKSLASDEQGKKQLLKIFEEGYLTSDLDIPELIKSGMSKQKIEEKKKKLDDFEKLIKDPNVKEVTDIQKFLQGIPWIFGPEYASLDVRDAEEAGIPDRRLKRIDGLSDILEIKLPNEELLRADARGRQYISPKLSESLGQLTGYLEHYISEYTEEREDETGEEIKTDRYGKYYKPKGILLIGRRMKPMNGAKSTIDAHPKNLRRLISYFHWIDVVTYDDLIERARNYLDMLSN